MSVIIGRDPVEGSVYLRATVERTGGPERVATETPPDDWSPRPFLGFVAPLVEQYAAAVDEQVRAVVGDVDPLLWDGDNA